MLNSFTARERHALLFMLLVIIAGLALPAIHQPESYHAFADQRVFLGIPHFADVVSNGLFAVAGVLGAMLLRRTALPAGTKAPFAVFFTGLALTAVGSGYYHWAPDSQTLVMDRLPMVIAFAGVIGVFLAQRVSPRLGTIGMWVSLATGAAGLLASVTTGNLALYLALQFGGLAGLVVGLLTLKAPRDGMPWWPLIGWYIVAKALELGDQVVWALTQQLVSGHTLKHLAAGMAGVVLWRALARTAPPAPNQPLANVAG